MTGRSAGAALILSSALAAALILAGSAAAHPSRQELSAPNVSIPIPAARPNESLPRIFQRQTVAFRSAHRPGTVVIRPRERLLYVVLSSNSAIRYGVGVPNSRAEWFGTLSIGRKAEWPSWRPSTRMIRLNPDYAAFRDGMVGGIDNPLGARALYLYRNGIDTLYRIHGTNEPWTIGEAVSSGCIRLINDDVKDLYRRVNVGTLVFVE